MEDREEKLKIVVLHLNGRVKAWYFFFHLSKGRVRWEEFVEEICRRFSDSIHSTLNLLDEFKKVEQKETVDTYLERFGDLKAWVLTKNPIIPKNFSSDFLFKA